MAEYNYSDLDRSSVIDSDKMQSKVGKSIAYA
jgi:hypothetical protein